MQGGRIAAKLSASCRYKEPSTSDRAAGAQSSVRYREPPKRQLSIRCNMNDKNLTPTVGRQCEPAIDGRCNALRHFLRIDGQGIIRKGNNGPIVEHVVQNVD
jgi:hypothetical protein